MCGARDGDHRSWTRTGTQFVKPSTKASRERNGRTCTTKFAEMKKEVTCQPPEWESQGSRVGELVPQVSGDEQRSHMSAATQAAAAEPTRCGKRRDAKERCDAYCSQTSEQDILTRDGPAGIEGQTPAESWLKRCGEWKCGTMLALRREDGAEVERTFLLSSVGAPLVKMCSCC